jgi:predicted transcriptional regulator
VPTKTIEDNFGLSEFQLQLIEDFVADYNCIDHFLRKALDLEDNVPFASLLKQYSQQNPGWRDADFLGIVAKVRNLILHGKTGPYGYPATPSPDLTNNLKACLSRLTNPALVIPRFQRPVERISSQDNLATVLRLIRQRDYSQFPVYDNGRFRGLLTENGITRWLAHHVATNLSLVELEDIHVKEVIENEEKRTNCLFVAQHTRVDDVVGRFSSGELLEAVLVTTTGKDSEVLLGIATRWDIIRMA